MATTCPASECDFTGSKDQVQGHLGGCIDGLHDGITKAVADNSADGKGTEGVTTKRLILVLVCLGVVVYLVGRESEPEKFWYDVAGRSAQNESINEPVTNQGVAERLAREAVA